jgi:hypothetical protein
MHVAVRGRDRLVSGQVFDLDRRRSTHRQVATERVSQSVPLPPPRKPCPLLLSQEPRSHHRHCPRSTVALTEHPLAPQMAQQPRCRLLASERSGISIAQSPSPWTRVHGAEEGAAPWHRPLVMPRRRVAHARDVRESAAATGTKRGPWRQAGRYPAAPQAFGRGSRLASP